MTEMLTSRDITLSRNSHGKKPYKSTKIEITDLEEIEEPHKDDQGNIVQPQITGYEDIVEKVQKSPNYVVNGILHRRLAALAKLGFEYGLGLDPAQGFSKHDDDIKNMIYGDLTISGELLRNTSAFPTVYDAVSLGAFRAHLQNRNIAHVHSQIDLPLAG